MNIKLHHHRLTWLIRKLGAESAETRQIARRLAEFLPLRFLEIRKDYSRSSPASKAERAAFTDQRYLNHIEEYCDVAYKGLVTRIEYDTHLMLFQARETLRPVRGRQIPPC